MNVIFSCEVSYAVSMTVRPRQLTAYWTLATLTYQLSPLSAYAIAYNRVLAQEVEHPIHQLIPHCRLESCFSPAFLYQRTSNSWKGEGLTSS